MKIRSLLVASAATFLVACSSTQPLPQPVASCVFADGSNQPAPEWICGAPVDGIELSEGPCLWWGRGLLAGGQVSQHHHPASCTSAVWRGGARRVQILRDRGAPLVVRGVRHLIQLFRVVVQQRVRVQAIREMMGACPSQGQHDERLETALGARVKSLPERAERRGCAHGQAGGHALVGIPRIPFGWGKGRATSVGSPGTWHPEESRTPVSVPEQAAAGDWRERAEFENRGDSAVRRCLHHEAQQQPTRDRFRV